ncbi:MAG: ribonuclease J [Mollicutes bacterium PWAP]|nr:ribonuclease J [Mollicutes bacterium PWAP]
MKYLNFFALGGQDENGKDAYIFENENTIIMINAGNKIPIKNDYGIDSHIAEFEYINNNKKFQGIFITHAQDEAFAALPYLLMESPNKNIYGSAFTINLVANRLNKYNIKKNSYKLIIVKENDEVQFNNLTVIPYEVLSSMPGSLGYKVTDNENTYFFVANNTEGNIPNLPKVSYKELSKKIGNIDVLVADTSKALERGKASEKHDVSFYLDEKLKNNIESNERLIVAVYDEDMSTILEVMRVAKRHNKPVVIYGSAFDFAYKTYKKVFKYENIADIMDFKEMNNSNNSIILVTSTWSRLFQRIVRIARGNDVFLKLKKNDHLLMVCPPKNGREVEYSESLDDVAKVTGNIYELLMDKHSPLTSTRDDITEMVKQFKPKYFIPISTLYRNMMLARDEVAKNTNIEQKNIVNLINGQVFKLSNKLEVSRKTFVKPVNDVIIDGHGIGDISKEVIREREILGQGGLITINIILDNEFKKAIKKPHIQLVGVTTKEDLKETQELISSWVYKILDDPEFKTNYEKQNKIRRKIQRLIERKFNRKPLVITTFFLIYNKKNDRLKSNIKNKRRSNAK